MTAHEFDRVVHAALDNGAARVILDLTRCEFFDSSQLNVLAHTTRPGSLAFSLIVPPDRIPHLTLGITQLDHAFRIYPRLQAALDGDEDSMHRTAIGQSGGT